MEAITIALLGVLIMFALIALHVPVGVSLAITGVGCVCLDCRF